MIISCPECSARYRINPAGSKVSVARVKCPGCNHVFELTLESPPSENVPDVSGKPGVLIVDDANFFREMIKDLLSSLSVDLLTASDGEEAWQLITTRKPELVLLDLNIPGKSGKDILQALQNSPLAADVKILAMSGVERGDETAAEVRKIGATDFINKSFKPRELEDRVKSILGL
jgi:predicted Zn finger-like uncharacterized protein